MTVGLQTHYYNIDSSSRPGTSGNLLTTLVYMTKTTTTRNILKKRMLEADLKIPETSESRKSSGIKMNTVSIRFCWNLKTAIRLHYLEVMKNITNLIRSSFFLKEKIF